MPPFRLSLLPYLGLIHFASHLHRQPLPLLLQSWGLRLLIRQVQPLDPVQLIPTVHLEVLLDLHRMEISFYRGRHWLKFRVIPLLQVLVLHPSQSFQQYRIYPLNIQSVRVWIPLRSLPLLARLPRYPLHRS